MAEFSEDRERCPICHTSAQVRATETENQYLCPRCGRYNLEAIGALNLRSQPLDGRQLANASGWIRENQRASITRRDLDWLRSVRTPTVSERATKALVELGRRVPNIGDSIDIDLGAADSIEWGRYYLVHRAEGSRIFVRQLSPLPKTYNRTRKHS